MPGSSGRTDGHGARLARRRPSRPPFSRAPGEPLAEGEDSLSGAIEYIDPRGAIGTNARFETPFTRTKFTIRPEVGTCLLWPSYVKHWVYPNGSADERVTVAFNSWFNRVAKA